MFRGPTSRDEQFSVANVTNTMNVPLSYMGV